MLPLLDTRQQFLFQVKPSLFPDGELCLAEMILWEKYYKQKNDK